MTTRLHRRHASLAAGLVALCAALPAVAQYSPAPPRPYPGLVNDYLRAKDPYANQWNVGVNVRGRYEGKDDSGFTAAGQNWDFAARGSGGGVNRDNNNHYFLTRVMPRVGYTGKWFEAFVEGRSSSAYDDERENNPPALAGLTPPASAAARRDVALTESDSDMNLHQAYIFVGNHKEFPVSAKIGRQEFAYGDQRQLGHFRWNNNARVFDAVKLRAQTQWFGVDAFTGGVVQNDNHNFNKSHPDTDLFSGLYFNFPSIASFTDKNIVEAYYFNRDVDRDSSREDWRGVPVPFRNPTVQDLDVYGLRLKSKPGAYGPWDYTAEVIYQGGSINNQNAAGGAIGPIAGPAVIRSARERDQDAYAAIAQLGYTWTESSLQPRLSFTYSYASGDKDRLDGESNTFQNLFATTHLHYGYMDLSSLQNLQDFRTAFTFKPTSTVTVALEHHYQLLATNEDYWYNVGGVARNGGAYAALPGSALASSSRELGNEVDLVVGWYPKLWLHLELGVSHYFAGDYIKETLSKPATDGGAKDSSYVYFQTTLNF